MEVIYISHFKNITKVISSYLHLYLYRGDLGTEDGAPFAYVSYEHYGPFFHGYLGHGVVG